MGRGAAAAAGRDAPLDEELPPLGLLDSEDRGRLPRLPGGEVEEPPHGGGGCAGADDGGVGAVPGEEAEGLEHEGLADPRGPRQGDEAGAEGEAGAREEREIPDLQLGEHGRPR